MKEIEILVEVLDTKESALEKLSAFESKGKKETLDVYFFDPLRADLKPTPEGRLSRSFRIREKDGKASIAYKLDNFDEKGMWTYSDEFESTVADFNTGMQIISHLGLEELVRIDNHKHTFVTPKYEIVLEEVKNLGLFMEVELLHQVEDSEVMNAKKEIQDFIDSLGLKVGPELNAGKPELMLRKKLAK